MNGSSLASFESHLAEIIWRNRCREQIVPAMIKLIKKVYPLDGPPNLDASWPLFPTWTHLTQVINID